MPPKLRTVVDLEGRIWERAREAAFKRRVSLSYLVNVALRDYLGLPFEVEPRRIGRPRKAKSAASKKKKGGRS